MLEQEPHSPTWHPVLELNGKEAHPRVAAPQGRSIAQAFLCTQKTTPLQDASTASCIHLFVCCCLVFQLLALLFELFVMEAMPEENKGKPPTDFPSVPLLPVQEIPFMQAVFL